MTQNMTKRNLKCRFEKRFATKFISVGWLQIRWKKHSLQYFRCYEQTDNNEQIIQWFHITFMLVQVCKVNNILFMYIMSIVIQTHELALYRAITCSNFQHITEFNLIYLWSSIAWWIKAWYVKWTSAKLFLRIQTKIS